MVKGLSIKFRSYTETIPKLLTVIKFEKELKKHTKIVLKPAARSLEGRATPGEFVEVILQYCLQNKNPDTQLFIAEGSDGDETLDVFEKKGYQALAEKYGIGIIDLNTAEVENIQDGKFTKFENIYYPKILLESFIISLPVLREDAETEIEGSLANMLGAFPAQYYQGFFSRGKNKIRKWPIKYSIHDILRCKMPDFAIIDASEQGVILAGLSVDMDQQAAKLLGKEAKSIAHLRLIMESFSEKEKLNDSEKIVPATKNSKS